MLSCHVRKKVIDKEVVPSKQIIHLPVSDSQCSIVHPPSGATGIRSSPEFTRFTLLSVTP